MISNEHLVLFTLVLARVSAFIALFPIFSKRQLPSLVKFGLSGALSVFWFSEYQGEFDLSSATALGGLVGLGMAIKELAIGAMLAMILGLLFWPAKVAGAYVGQELGLSLAAISDPGSQDSSTLVTRIFDAFALLVFFGLNLHHLVILTIHASFNQVLTSVNLSTLPVEDIVRMFNSVGNYGLSLIGPILIIFLLLSVSLAFLNRAAPTLNLFSVGMSIRAGVGVLVLFLFSPVLFAGIQAYLLRVQTDIEELFRAF